MFTDLRFCPTYVLAILDQRYSPYANVPAVAVILATDADKLCGLLTQKGARAYKLTKLYIYTSPSILSGDTLRLGLRLIYLSDLFSEGDREI
jgi:hypothetical protein